MSRRGQRVVGGSLTLILATWGVFALLHQTRDWLDERSLRNQVSLRANIAVWASSSSPPVGGRVDYSVSIRNLGERPIRVTKVDIVNTRLRIRNRDTRPRVLGAGQTVSVPLSVRIDCTAGEGQVRQERLRGAIAAYPLSGRLRTVRPTFGHATLITDVADTLCRVRADLQGAELSGPVIRQFGDS
jgi:hypothetical protein